ncbi:MAG: hypothetical protein H7836_15945 [Magnetococcus sp. YQC-3]
MIRGPEAGAMTSVMILTTIFTGLALGLLGLGRQLDGGRERDLLLQSRIYWAMRGQMDYLLSRARASEITDRNSDHACPALANCVNDDDKIIFLNELLSELTDVRDLRGRTVILADDTRQRSWFYPEESAGYRFAVTNSDGARDNTSFDHDNHDDHDDGRLRLVWMPAIPAGEHADFINSVTRLEPGLRVDLCMGSATGSTVGVGCETDGDSTRSATLISIERLTRVLP